jgi:CheY-like chemotaxis protein
MKLRLRRVAAALEVAKFKAVNFLENIMVTRSILIVEDEPAIAQSFQHILKRSLEYNYRLKTVSSAEEALESVKQSGAFDVILLDYFLPGLTGGDFLRALRTRDQETVVIVISASQDYRIVHDVFKLGADDYLTKEELANQYVLEKSILAGLEKREYQKDTVRNEIARQRIDAITTIIRTVHHELNNPMAIIDLTLNKIRSSETMADPELTAIVKEIQDNVDRMSDILRRLLNFRDEMYNEGLRGLKLFSLPDKPTEEK